MPELSLLNRQIKLYLIVIDIEMHYFITQQQQTISRKGLHFSCTELNETVKST